MDVSAAIDKLLSGVIPERISEVKEAWGSASDRVRLVSSQGFLLQQLYGTVQVSEVALRQIWLVGYAAQVGIESYSSAIYFFQLCGQPLDFSELSKIDGQAELDALFVSRVRAVNDLGRSLGLDDFDWPADVPYPDENMAFESIQDKAAFDLICMAGAYVFLHEIRHAQLETDINRPTDTLDEEIACDRYALEMMIGRVSDYSKNAGYPAEKVLAKRLFGALFAKLVILTLTPKKAWAIDSEHPSVAKRIRGILEAADGRIPDTFWSAIAAMLAAFTRYFGLLHAPIPFTSCRDLAFKICDAIGTEQS